MKKNYKNLLLGVAAMLSLPSAAQLVSTYYFTQYNESYVAVTGGTVFGTSQNDDERFVNPAVLGGGTANSGPGFPIGFDFVYNNVTYDRFGVNTNGWISLGQSTLTPNPVNTQVAAAGSDYQIISSGSTAPANLQCRIAGLSLDITGRAGSSLRAETIGAAPNRTLVVQWSNYKEYGIAGENFNFQIRLCETSNKVSVIYGPFVSLSPGSAQVGLRGQAATNYNNRRVLNSAPSWSASIPGTTNAQVCNFNGSLLPANGQVFEWSIPTPCSGVPLAADALSSYSTVCSNTGVNLSLSTAYNAYTGITYQWQNSTTGINGTYANITTGTGSGTTAAIPSPTMGTSTAYRAIITCASGASISSTPILVTVGLPQASSAVPNFSTICPGMNTSLGLSSPYSGAAYQWQRSPSGTPGTYTSVPNATLATLASGALNATTYYQAIISCTATPAASIITTPTDVVVAVNSVTNTVPYLETFEGLQANNHLPNCQWMATNLNNQTYTYISATGSDNQYNHTPGGSKFASFIYDSNDAFFTNGIFLQTGITYSAAVWYITDGYSGWDDLSLSINTQQVMSTNTVIASVSDPFNTIYSLLSNTFTVPSTGFYYISVKAESNSDPYALSFDDLSITAPCDLNPSSFTATAPQNICTGRSAVLTASAAPLPTSPVSYTWSTTGTPSGTVSVSPTATTIYTVMGTNTLGCVTSHTVQIHVNNLPIVSIYAQQNEICEGESATQVALGSGTTYTWSNGDNTAVITDSPTLTTTYTLTVADVNGCVNSTTQTITVNPLPVITATVSKNTICKGESTTLQASGGDDYIWQTGSNSLMTGQSISVSPTVTTTYTVMGGDANGCMNTTTLEQKVDNCTGINALAANGVNANVYPNPNNGEFVVSLNNGAAKTIEVMDVTGRILLTSTTGKDAVSLNINDFAKGIYYVKIQSNNTVEIIKVVKQ